MLLALILTLAAPVPSVPAIQQRTEQELGSRIGVPRRVRVPESRTRSTVTESRLVMAAYGRCVVEREASKLGKALAAPDDGSFEEAARILVSDDCLFEGEIRFTCAVLRRAVYTELYRRRAGSGEGRTWGPEVTKIDLSVPAQNEGHRSYLALMAFADCVAQQDRNLARAIVVAPTSSERQNAAFQEIVPKFPACINDGVQLRLNKNVIEGALAEVLYRGVAPFVAKPTGGASQ